MASLNKVTLIGHLGKDPVVRTFQAGGRVANFSLATSESWKDKATGEKKDRTEWHNVSITNDALVGIAEKYLRKGSKVYLEGQLQTRKYQDKDTGADRYTTEVVLRPYNGSIIMLDSKKSEGGEYTESEYQQVNEATPAQPARDDMDDEIPF